MTRKAPTPLARDVEAYMRGLQTRIIQCLQEVDGGAFQAKEWQRPGGGGGRMALLRGDKIEKAGANWSAVWGDHNPIDGKPFYATGVSVITHPKNPKAPTIHMNVRFFQATSPAETAEEGYHFGGGMDLTPMGFSYAEDTAHLHKVCEEAAGARYPEWKKACDAYFFVKHRNRPRGVGGIFYDQFRTGDPEADFATTRNVGDRFLDAYIPILKRRLAEPYTDEDRDVQLRERAVYAEFNLVYDRGTKFGFESGGNPEAILASMPPLVKW